MAKPWVVVDRIIKNSDLILNVLDARFPDKTMNSIIAGRIKSAGKKFFYILNKSDLVEIEQIKRAINYLRDEAPVVAFSAKEQTGKGKLLDFIKRFAKERKKSIRVGVVGYPNTGKSSIINVLAGRKAARTSPIAGFTKGKQWIRISEDVLLIDTPGVIPTKEKSEVELVMKDAVTQVEDPEGVATELLEKLCKKNRRAIEQFYNIEAKDDPYETLEAIAKAKHKLKKGGLLDLDAAGRMIIEDWQRGKLVI